VFFLILLHGYRALYILFFVLSSYSISFIFKGSWLNPWLSWSHAIILLLGMEYISYQPFFSRLGLFEGYFPRWDIIYKMSLLRLLSYNLDLFYFCRQRLAKSEELPTSKDAEEVCRGCQAPECPTCDRQRIALPLNGVDYAIAPFLVYVLYLPLYLAGPIMTYNDFIRQSRKPLNLFFRSKLFYGLRLLLSFLTLELLLHLFHPVAIKDTQAWVSHTPGDLLILAYLNLKVVWLKLLIIWRFFRFVALLDGIQTMENMGRCISTATSTLGFWRAWHRSFNRWLVRYLYIPLGGRAYSYLSIWVIFTFVALWHDIKPHLLAWSWLICLAFLPEILLSLLSRKLKWEKLFYYRHLLAAGAASNMFVLSLANAVGFVFGGDLLILVSFFKSFKGILTLLMMAITMFAAAQLALEVRATERRHGIFLNY